MCRHLPCDMDSHHETCYRVLCKCQDKTHVAPLAHPCPSEEPCPLGHSKRVGGVKQCSSHLPSEKGTLTEPLPLDS